MTRPQKRPDGWPTRSDKQCMSPAELAITDAMYAVENQGGSIALTDAVTLLSKARNRVADHEEGTGDSTPEAMALSEEQLREVWRRHVGKRMHNLGASPAVQLGIELDMPGVLRSILIEITRP